MLFQVEIKEGLIIALRAIRANKMRSALTMLGIFIGIVSVTLMATGIEGVDRSFERSAAAFGTNVLYVQKFPWVSGEDWWRIRNRRDLRIEFADAIERQAHLVDAVAPVVTVVRPARYEDRVFESSWVNGTTESYLAASGTSLKEGRFFSPEEAVSARPVCVIGANVAETLFPSEDPLDKTIRVGGYPYRILGILEKQGGLFGVFTADNRIYIPINSFRSYFGSHRDVTINVRIASHADPDDAVEEVRGIMRKLRGLGPLDEDDFNINQQSVLMQTFGQVSGVIAGVGLFITGLSLFVGGIGIMNIMFVSVTERTREIGIRKALGARRRTILMQFLIESSLIGLIGGTIGLMVAYPLSLIVDQVLPTAMPLSVVGIALFVSGAVGVISGLFPAYRASRLDPVEAIRHE